MKIAIGTAQFGMDYGVSNTDGTVQQKEIAKILEVAIESKISVLDTAQAYGDSEVQIGKNDLQGFKIITKLKPGSSKDVLKNSVINSLNNLQCSRLYGILFHQFEDFQNCPESINELYQLKRLGLVEKIGFSLYYPSDLEKILNAGIGFDLLQIPFSILDQRFRPYFAKLKQKNIEIHARSVFLQGLVFLQPESMRPGFKNYAPHLKKFQSTIKSSKKDIAEVCLNYVNNQPEIDKIVIGICSAKELIMNVKFICSYKQSEKEWYDSMEKFKTADEKLILPFNWELQ